MTYATDSVPTGLTVGDFNKDTKLDLVVADGGNSWMSVFLSNRDGIFQKQKMFKVVTNPFSVTVADLNNDAKLDLVASNSNI